MKTIFVLICLFVIPYLSIDMNAMLDELKTLEDKKMTFSMENDADNLFKEYVEQKGEEIKEHMVKHAVSELIAAWKLKKGGFNYPDYAGKTIVLNDDALDELESIAKGNAEHNIQTVAKYMEDHKLANIDKQTAFMKYHYAKKNHPDVLEAFLEKSEAIKKSSVASAEFTAPAATEGTEAKPEALAELETKAPAETPVELKTPATTEDSDELVKGLEEKTPATTEDSDELVKGLEEKTPATTEDSDELVKGLEEKTPATTEDSDELETTASDHSNANKPHVLHNIKSIVQSNKFIALAALLGIGTVGITKLLTADTTPNQTIDNDMYTDADMYDTKDTPNQIGYSTVYILVTISIACLLITIGLGFYIVRIAYPYNAYYTLL